MAGAGVGLLSAHSLLLPINANKPAWWNRWRRPSCEILQLQTVYR